MKRFYLIAALSPGCSVRAVPGQASRREVPGRVTIEGTGADKILLIPVRGVISDSPREGLITTNPSLVQEVVSQLRKAEKDKRIKAVLFKVNTPGGTITASDILYHEISGYRQRTSAKVVSAMMDIATSGGYYLSLPADLIMAHPTTLTGSVGVIFVQPKAMGLMGKIGLGVECKVWEEQGYGSPFGKYGAEQKLLQATVDRLGDRFVSLVKKHRTLDAQALAEMSTAGSFWREALKGA